LTYTNHIPIIPTRIKRKQQKAKTMELGYKDLQAKPVTSWIDHALDFMWMGFLGAFIAVAALFGADAYEGAMMLMGF
jgi:hypothetical protein